MKRSPLLPLVLCSTIFLAGVVLPRTMVAADAPIELCFLSIGYGLSVAASCYAPIDEAAVAAQLPVSPVEPQQALAASGLPLVQIEVQHTTALTVNVAAAPVSRLLYLYASVPVDFSHDGYEILRVGSCPATSVAPYAVIAETVTPAVGARQATLMPLVGTADASGTLLSCGWEYDAPLAGHGLTLQIISNLSQSQVQAIGDSLSGYTATATGNTAVGSTPPPGLLMSVTPSATTTATPSATAIATTLPLTTATPLSTASATLSATATPAVILPLSVQVMPHVVRPGQAATIQIQTASHVVLDLFLSAPGHVLTHQRLRAASVSAARPLAATLVSDTRGHATWRVTLPATLSASTVALLAVRAVAHGANVTQHFVVAIAAPVQPPAAPVAAQVSISSPEDLETLTGRLVDAYNSAHNSAVLVHNSLAGTPISLCSNLANQAELALSDLPGSAFSSNNGEILAGPDYCGDLAALPIALSATVFGYTLPSTANAAPLALSAQVVAAIYGGRITQWNDPAIAALNPGLSLPSLPIRVLLPTLWTPDGTSLILDDWLTQTTGGNWAPRTINTLLVSERRTLSRAMHFATSIIDPGAFWYTSSDDRAVQAGMVRLARVVNASGHVVAPTVAAMVAAERGTLRDGLPQNFARTFSTVTDPDAYPLTHFVYLLIHRNLGQAATHDFNTPPTPAALTTMRDVAFWLTAAEGGQGTLGALAGATAAESPAAALPLDSAVLPTTLLGPTDPDLAPEVIAAVRAAAAAITVS